MEILENSRKQENEIVRCRNCGQLTRWGEMRMCCGYVGCDNIIKINGEEKECYFGDLQPRILDARENDYEKYLEGKFYRYEDNLGGLENA